MSKRSEKFRRETPTPSEFVEELLRTPSAIEGEGGAISEKQSRERGRMLQVRDQMAQLAAENGLKVPDSIAESLLPTTTATDYKGGGVSEATAYGWENRGYPGANLSEGVARLMIEDNLLPTPVASEGTKAPAQQNSETKAKTGQVWLSNVAKDMEPLLGTPRTSAANGPSTKQINAGAPKGRIEDQIAILPTPDAYSADRGGSQDSDKRKSGGHQVTLADETEKGTNWGKFERAVRRWEQATGREAPAPTKPDGKDGAHRLSSAFTEWMMGLPKGWITDVGLSRNDELKACGNGVVPHQAEMALRILLQGGVAQPLKTGTQLPTPTVADTYTDRMESTQQKEGSMHSVTLPQAVRMIPNEH